MGTFGRVRLHDPVLTVSSGIFPQSEPMLLFLPYKDD